MNERCSRCNNAIYANSKEPVSCFLDRNTIGGVVNMCTYRHEEDLEKELEVVAYHKIYYKDDMEVSNG